MRAPISLLVWRYLLQAEWESACTWLRRGEVDLERIRRAAQRNPGRVAANTLLLGPIRAGLREWTLSPEGPSFPAGVIDEATRPAEDDAYGVRLRRRIVDDAAWAWRHAVARYWIMSQPGLLERMRFHAPRAGVKRRMPLVVDGVAFTAEVTFHPESLDLRLI